jgi:hypothetical protein
MVVFCRFRGLVRLARFVLEEKDWCHLGFTSETSDFFCFDNSQRNFERQ